MNLCLIILRAAKDTGRSDQGVIYDRMLTFYYMVGLPCESERIPFWNLFIAQSVYYGEFIRRILFDCRVI